MIWFVFLVALGVDYKIFLVSRGREEAVDGGTRNGMLRALVATGPVITSAGLILAGTFAARGAAAPDALSSSVRWPTERPVAGAGAQA